MSSTNSPEWVACPECGAKQNADEPPAAKSSTAAGLLMLAMICATVLAAVWLVAR